MGGEKLWPSFRLGEVPMAPGAGVTIKLQDLPLGIDPTEIILGRRKDVVPRMLPFSIGADEIHGGLHRCWHTVKAFK